MSIQNDISFLNRLPLDNFKELEKYKFNFRCPICLDSKVSKKKARGYAIQHKTKDCLYVYCHNCNYTASFFYFIKELNDKGIIDALLFNSYVFQAKNDREYTDVITFKEKKKEVVKENKFLLNVKRFKEDSDVRQYLIKRKVEDFNDIYFSLNLKHYVNNFYTKKYQNEYDLPRIVFPIMNDNELVGFQGRNIYSNEYRYLNVKLNEHFFVYKKKDIDKSKIVLITEGIFDCLMLDNSLAMLGSDLNDEILEKFDKVIFVYDNEKRNEEILKKYKKVIHKEGIGLFIWPKSIKYKDVNEWALYEDKHKIQEVIMENSYFGKLEKYLHFVNWV
jgi:hypothetical protein